MYQQTKVLGFAALAIIFLVAIACTNEPSRSFSSPVLSPSPAASKSPTRLSITPDTSSPIPSPTFRPNEGRVQPIVTAGDIQVHSWSPNGQWLAYWEFTAAEAEKSFEYPPGTLHFFNSQTGETCESTQRIGYGYSANPLDWLADGRVLIITDAHQTLAGKPCSDNFSNLNSLFPFQIHNISSHNPQQTLFVLVGEKETLVFDSQSQDTRPVQGGTGISWAPSGKRFSTTTRTGPPDFIANTFVVDAETGKILDNVKWKYPDAEGQWSGPTWLDDEQFVIGNTLDQGPILVTIGKNVIEIAPELFNRPSAPTLDAAAQASNDSDRYHIALSDLAENIKGTLLYHSENGEVEELPFQRFGEFSPNGSSLIAYEDGYKAWTRALDPAETQSNLFLTQKEHPFPISWSLEGNRTAVHSANEILVFSIPFGEKLKAWKTESESIFPGPWSPDGRFLAAEGDLGSNQRALYVVKVPDN